MHTCDNLYVTTRINSIYHNYHSTIPIHSLH
uniref:Uncharacterized protein n=1 Tax=Arundo donax TaxID=35708 RepID=A0A0A9NPV2_ARUDO